MAHTPSTTSDTREESSYRFSWWKKQPLWAKLFALPLLAGFSGTTALLLGLRFAPLPDGTFVSPTEIDAQDGQMLSQWTLLGSQSERVPLARIPKELQEATIAVEDAQFYHHHALNLLSILRAASVDLRHGHVVEGGSTITQQLAKNLFLSQDRTFTRKAKEALLAVQLELHVSKSAILNQYLNTIYYGHGAYGVGAASELYFNKPVDYLTLPEAAMLAGIPKGPSIYSPLSDFDAAKRRQWIVLKRMVDTGYITRDEANQAYQTPIHIATVHPPLKAAPYFTSTVIDEVERRFRLTSDDLYKGDVNITTTLDPVLQQAAERAIATTLPKQGNLQAALIALDPKTGAIRAMVGGRDYATSPYNRTYAERQPGSSFKAVLYSAALASGWNPARQVDSEETTFLYDEDRFYTVHDYENFYAHRPLTLREALARSDNVYAVTTNLDIGPENVINMAHKMGISSPMKPYPTLALGVFPTSPLEMATAYATLANGGYRITPYAVQEVRAAHQNRVWQTEVKPKRVLSPQLTFQMSDLMRSVLEPHGTGYAVHQYLHRPAAAKTGTTDTDNWMVGYTPNLVCAVWVGYDDNKRLSTSDSHMAGPIWAKFMGTAQQRLPSDWYQPPTGLVKRVLDPLTAKLATDTCNAREADYFKAGTEPTEYCPLHKPIEKDKGQPSTNRVHRHWWQRFF